MILIIHLAYLVVFLAMILASAFIVFHIVSYSFTYTSKIITLLIFVPVAAILLFTNYILFSAIPLEQVFSSFIS